MKLRRSIHQRIVLLRLSHDCKAVVDARTRIIDSATILQRAWRAYREVKGTKRTVCRHSTAMGKKPRREKQQVLGSACHHDTKEEHDVDIWLL